MVDIGFSKFVSLGTTLGTTTGLVSVLIPLELAPGIDVGVLTKNLSTEVSWLGPIRRIILTSKINVCAFRETEILNNVSERSSFILV